MALGPILDKQREFFASGRTKPWAFRDAQLRKLKRVIEDNETILFGALARDLRKPEYEAYGTEVGIALSEIGFALDHLEEWMEPRKVPTPLTLLPASSFVYPDPFGVCLIMAPWNYPFALAISPLIGAIAAGNCAVVKPSELAPHTSAALSVMLGANFDPAFTAVVEGGLDVNRALLAERFDKIFFTGSPAVGRIVMKAAAEHLTPVTLELGGKSPCIVDDDADLGLAAKRIAWGKLLNAGQTCVAPDYLLIQRDVKERFVEAFKSRVAEFYGADPKQSPDLPRIVNERHFDRIEALLAGQTLLSGGKTDRAELYIEPTLVDSPDWDAKIMSEEIFGPVLPVLEFAELGEALRRIAARPKPLALYYFGSDEGRQERVLAETSSGGGCINDVVLHLASAYLPFGGVGESGIGSYHGKGSFDAFTHYKSVLKKATFLDDPFRYPPYKGKLKFLRWLFN